MISITITLPDGSTYSRSANNTKGSAILSAVADEIGATGTSGEKADGIVGYLARHLMAVAVAHTRKTRAAEAEALADADRVNLDWG